MAGYNCSTLDSADEQELITSYYDDGYTYAEICTFLHLRHGIVITVDQLRYRLKRMGLGRRRPELQTSLEEVEAAVSVRSLMPGVLMLDSNLTGYILYVYRKSAQSPAVILAIAYCIKG